MACCWKEHALSTAHLLACTRVAAQAAADEAAAQRAAAEARAAELDRQLQEEREKLERLQVGLLESIFLR